MATGSHIIANGVNTYYESYGEGAPLLALHGAFSSAETFSALAPILAKHVRVIVPERRGHGRTADMEGPLSYDVMAQDTIAFMGALGIERASVVGYSDGANVGMLMAMAQPSLVDKFVSISGNFDARGLDEGTITFFREATAESLPDAFGEEYKRLSPDGPEHWPIVFEKTKRMILNEPNIAPADLAKITARTLVMCADRDLMSLEHSTGLFRAIPDAQLCVVPGTSHLLLYERPELVHQLILSFLTEEVQKIDIGL
ncbi:MAG: alpha/beta hydrolase [Dehalococcoidia bacterium]